MIITARRQEIVSVAVEVRVGTRRFTLTQQEASSLLKQLKAALPAEKGEEDAA